MRWELTVTAKGQVTLRRSVLAHMGIRPGDKLTVDLLSGGRVELRPAGRQPLLSRLKASLKRPGQRPRTLEEIQAAIEAGRAGGAEKPE